MRETLLILKKNHSKEEPIYGKKRDREIAETVSDFFDSRREESGNCPKVYAGITEAYRILDGMKISKQKILEYREKLMEIYQPKTVNTKLSAVNAYLEFSGLSACTVKLLKIQRQAFADEEKELSEQEYRRLLQAAKRRSNHRLYYVILTIGGTGIRVSELKFITVEALKNRKVQIHLKGKDRTILLPQKLRKKLNQYVKTQSIHQGPVFQTRSGKPLDRSNICHEMKEICQEADVDRKKVFPHNLRHLFARCFYAVEKNLALLADILGHSSIETHGFM